MNVLLSIKPKYVQKIFSGKKKYEFRRRIFKEKVERVIVYSTRPKCEVVGYFLIKDILEDTPEKLWEKTFKYSGVKKPDYFKYFENREKAFAIEIGTYQEFAKPFKLNEISKNFKAPQSYQYISEDLLKEFYV